MMRMLVVALTLSCFVGGFTQAGESIAINSNSFAAIAYSRSTGKYAYGYDYRSRKAAEKAALEKCDAADAFIANWVNFGFAALALGNDKSCVGIGYVYGNGCRVIDAKNAALEDCRKCTTGAYIAVVLSSDGQFLWDHRDNVTVIDKNGNVYDGYGRPIGATPSPSASKDASALGKASSEAGKDH